MVDTNNFINEKISKTPQEPGVYLLKDKHNVVIYIGKSNNLRNRLKYYFISQKTHSFYENFLIDIYDFEYIIVDNQFSALVLERNLIKKNKPKFNILMTDDKEYPYIQITNEKYPRILYLRKINKRKGKFYGPFPDGLQARTIWKILNKTFPLRKCNKLPKKKCIYFYIDQCLAPCTQNIDPLIYLKYVSNINRFFKGDTSHIIENITIKMDNYSSNKEYEKANKMKNLILSIQNSQFLNKTVEFKDNVDRDVIGYYCDDNFISIIMMNFRHGKLLNVINDIQLNVKSIPNIIETFVVKCYEKIINPKYLVTNLILDNELLNSIGIKIIMNKSLVKNANRNAQDFLYQETNKKIREWKERNKALTELSRLVGLKKVQYIELYDNSHISQTNYISAVIVYYNGQPKKSLYRKYKLSNTITNDINAFEEMIVRRFKKQPEIIPDLIIVDGGKAQVNIVSKTINKCGFSNIKVCGLVKNNAHKTDALYYNNKKILLDKKSSLYLLLFKMQTDIHNYAISFFNDQKSKSLFFTELNNIKGLGKVNIKRLISGFGTYEKIKTATISDLLRIIKNKKIANNIFIYFQNYKSKL